jgi:hypothetical protein
MADKWFTIANAFSRKPQPKRLSQFLLGKGGYHSQWYSLSHFWKPKFPKFVNLIFLISLNPSLEKMDFLSLLYQRRVGEDLKLTNY